MREGGEERGEEDEGGEEGGEEEGQCRKIGRAREEKREGRS